MGNVNYPKYFCLEMLGCPLEDMVHISPSSLFYNVRKTRETIFLHVSSCKWQRCYIQLEFLTQMLSGSC